MTEEIINLKDFLVHHYDDWGRLYCVEFKGSPLELENSIKRLEQERDDIQDRLSTLADTYQEARNVCKRLEQENKQMKSALEEIRKMVTSPYPGKPRDVLKIINEVLE